MAAIQFEGRRYDLSDGETVLDGLLRHGVSLRYSCKAGVCGTCMMRATGGQVPTRAQLGLKDSWKARGYFMACSCIPENDLELASTGEDFQFYGIITSLRPLSHDVVQATLRAERNVEYRAGQYLTIVRQDGLARSYSIASLPESGFLDFHVRRIPEGRMSGWFHEQARPGERVTLLGPSGECFYVPGREEQPLLLAGTGTGLAPLYGIVQDALRRGHRGPIHLLHGALRPEGLYLVDELRTLAQTHPQFHYSPVVVQGEAAGLTTGALDKVLEDRFQDLTGWRGFVCGDPAIVQKMKKTLFLAGMASREILADAFIAAAAAKSGATT